MLILSLYSILDAPRAPSVAGPDSCIEGLANAFSSPSFSDEDDEEEVEEGEASLRARYFLTMAFQLMAVSRKVRPRMLSVEPMGRLPAPPMPPSAKVGETPSTVETIHSSMTLP